MALPTRELKQPTATICHIERQIKNEMSTEGELDILSFTILGAPSALSPEKKSEKIFQLKNGEVVFQLLDGKIAFRRSYHIFDIFDRPTQIGKARGVRVTLSGVLFKIWQIGSLEKNSLFFEAGNHVVLMHQDKLGEYKIIHQSSNYNYTAQLYNGQTLILFDGSHVIVTGHGEEEIEINGSIFHTINADARSCIRLLPGDKICAAIFFTEPMIRMYTPALAIENYKLEIESYLKDTDCALQEMKSDILYCDKFGTKRGEYRKGLRLTFFEAKNNWQRRTVEQEIPFLPSQVLQGMHIAFVPDTSIIMGIYFYGHRVTFWFFDFIYSSQCQSEYEDKENRKFDHFQFLSERQIQMTSESGETLTLQVVATPFQEIQSLLASCLFSDPAKMVLEFLIPGEVKKAEPCSSIFKCYR